MSMMKAKIYTLFGIIGPLLAYLSIGVSISGSPWFSWYKNALSDLGHSVKSEVAPIFNGGLMIAGFMIVIYAITTFRIYAKYSSYFMVSSAFFLQLVATFDEVYGPLHTLISILFFISIGMVSISYAIEKKSVFSVIIFILSLFSWLLYGVQKNVVGIALPEIIASLAVTLLLFTSAIRLYLRE